MTISLKDAETAKRLAALRLECLKLAHAGDDGVSMLAHGKTQTSCYIDAAREMFEFVTDAPKEPDPLHLFVVRRLIEITGCESSQTHLSIGGDLAHWTIERAAFRFTSEADAVRAVDKHSDILFGFGVLPVFVIEPLPAGTELF